MPASPGPGRERSVLPLPPHYEDARTEVLVRDELFDLGNLRSVELRHVYWHPVSLVKVALDLILKLGPLSVEVLTGEVSDGIICVAHLVDPVSRRPNRSSAQGHAALSFEGR